MTVTEASNLNDLLDATKGVVDNWEKGDLAAAVRQLAAAAKTLQAVVNEDIVERAQEVILGREDIQIDSFPLTSETEDGVWVLAWVYVPNEAENDE